MGRDGTDDDDPKSPDPSRVLSPRNKITLAFKGPPLALPDDGDPATGDSPQMPVAERPEKPAAPRPEQESGHDGWSRDRASRGSGVHPAVSPATPSSRGADETDDAIGLVDRRHPSEPSVDLATEMLERFALDDFTGALGAAELLLGRIPHHVEAARYAALCRQRLEALYVARLGSLREVPVVTVPDSEVRWLGLDHRTGFVVSHVDGKHDIEELIDISGMPRLEVLKVLVDLLDGGTIRMR